MATSEQTIRNIRRLEKELPEIVVGGLFAASNRLIAEQKFRIFNLGRTSRGNPLGRYRSKRWRELRKAKGRQIAKKDLQFQGELFRGFVVGRRGRQINFGFTRGVYNDNWRRKVGLAPNGKTIPIGNVATWQEEFAGEPIFIPSTQEINQAEKDATEFVLNGILNTFR